MGAFSFDYHNQDLLLDNHHRALTKREADLLKFFVERKNQVVQRSQILEQIWGQDDYFLGRSLDVFISRLRKYLKPDPSVKIENIHGSDLD